MPRPKARVMPKLEGRSSAPGAAEASNRESRLAPRSRFRVHIRRSAAWPAGLTPPRGSRRLDAMISSRHPSTARRARPRGASPGAETPGGRKRAARSGRRSTILLAITTGALATACLSGGTPPGAGSALDASAREEARARRIEVLETEIAEDRRQLADLVADPTIEDEQVLHENPTLRALASRIAERTEELERLQAGLDGKAAAR